MSDTGSTIKENKMGTMPVNRLLITMSVPMVISMLVQALYNVVDSIFVAYISENALTAVSLSYPIQNLMIAFGTGAGVGINALLAKSLGEKDFKSTGKIAGVGLFVTFVTYIVFALIGLFFSRTFFAMQTDDTEIIELGTAYLSICCIFSFGCLFQFTLEKILQSTGKTMYTMITQGVGAVINIVLDPVLIFGYFGLPSMGVSGAAVATVIGQIAAAVLALWLNACKNKEISLHIRNIRPEGRTIKCIYSVGTGSIAMMALSSVMNFGMNTILMAYTATATAVFGIYQKLQSFTFMPLYGLNNGMVPILSYNYGARRAKRMDKTLKLSVLYAVCYMVICTIVFLVFPEWLISIFNASQAMLVIGIPALRIIGVSLIFAGFSVVCSSIFQALGKGAYSTVISIFRQLIPLLPIAYFLSLSGQLSLIWLALPIVEITGAIINLFLLRAVRRQHILPFILTANETADATVSLAVSTDSASTDIECSESV